MQTPHPTYPQQTAYQPQPGVQEAQAFAMNQPPHAAAPHAVYHPNSDYYYQYQMDHYANPPYTPPPPADASPNVLAGWLDFSSSSYLKGFLLGAGITFVATNPTVQKTIMKGVVKLWTMAQGGVEEVKERIQDVKAEMSQE